jgi:hypothetical protein
MREPEHCPVHESGERTVGRFWSSRAWTLREGPSDHQGEVPAHDQPERCGTHTRRSRKQKGVHGANPAQALPPLNITQGRSSCTGFTSIGCQVGRVMHALSG